MLVLLYWVLAIPNKVSIDLVIFTRINLGLILGSTLGVHALVLLQYVHHCQKLFNSAKFITLVPKFIGCTFRLHYKITYFLS